MIHSRRRFLSGLVAGLFAILFTLGCEKPAYKPVEPPTDPGLKKSGPEKIAWPAEYISPVDGSKMLLVKGGSATLGSLPGTKGAATDEFPRQDVHIEPFYIDETEVTIQRYELFVDAGGYTNPGAWKPIDWDWLRAKGIDTPVNWLTERSLDPMMPVTFVTYVEADSWARWAGRRLPTEFEWEYAARGTDMRRYPWGDDEALAPQPTTDRPVAKSSGEPASACGAYDMGGGVREWTSSGYRRYPGSNDRNIEYSDSMYVTRGGWFGGQVDEMRCADRSPEPKDRAMVSLGFRTVIDARLAYPDLAARAGASTP